MTVRLAAPTVLPGTDYRRTADLVDAQVRPPHLGPLPELPMRGQHATLLGRALAQLTELYAELTSYGWRLVQRPGADHSRAVSLLSSDVATLAEVRGERAEALDDGAVPLTVEVLGPVSLAAQLHLPGGEKALIDHGARRDLADALAAGTQEHVAHVRRSTGAEAIHVTVLEPDCAQVGAGLVPTASGYRTVRSLPRDEMRQLIGVLVHSLRSAGAESVMLDFGEPVSAEQVDDFRSRSGVGVDGFTLPVHLAQAQDWERAAELAESGTSLRAALLAPGEAEQSMPLPEVTQLAGRLLEPWRSMGMPLTALSAFTVSGSGAAHRGRMARSHQAAAGRAVSRLRDAAEALSEQIQQ